MSRSRFLAVLLYSLAPLCGLALLLAAQRPLGLSVLPSARMPLTVAIRSPAPDAVSGASVVVAGTTSREASVVVFVNGQAIESGSTDPNGDFSVSGVPMRPGANAVVVEATTIRDFPPISGRASVDVVNASAVPAPPALDPLPPVVGQRQLAVRGMAEPGADVELDVDGPGVQRSAPAGTAVADRFTGRFQAELALLAPGPAVITARAFRDGTAGPPSLQVAITYDPAPGIPPAAAPTRRLHVTLWPTSAQMDVAVDLPLVDPRARDVLAGRTDLPGFVKSVFGDVILSPGGSAFSFTDVQPAITVYATSLHVRARSNPAFGYVQPTDTFVLTTYPSGFPDDVNDSFTLQLNTYHFGSMTPAPSTRSGDTATWNGPADLGSGVRAQLVYDPLANPGEWFAQFPASVVGYPLALVVSVWLAGLLVLPIAWVRWLLRRLPETLRPEARRLDQLAVALVSLGLVQPVLALLNLAVQTRLTPCITAEGRLACQVQTGMGIVNAGGLAVGAMAMLLLLGFRRRPWVVWPRTLVTGVLGALLVADVVEVVGLGLTPDQISWIGWRLPAAAIGVTAFSILIVLFARVPTRLRSLSAGPRAVVAVIAGLGAIVVAVPNQSSVFGDLIPVSTALTASVGNLFGIVAGALRYAVLPGLFAILVLRADTAFARSVGLLLFAAYVVGKSATVLLVPVPMILAILAYDRLLLLSPDEVAKRTAAAPEVIGRRTQLVESWREAAVARRVMTASTDLAQQIMAGTLTMQQFFDRQRGVTRFIHEQERVQAGGGQLLSRDVVLGIGPSADWWENGRLALRYGLVLAVLLQLGHLLAAAITGTRLVDPRSPYLVLSTLQQLGLPLLDWLVGALVFGILFNWIRGRSGLNKGLRFAVIVTACLVPTWVSSLSSLAAIAGVLFYAAQRVLFYTVLGAWAFDVPTLRRALDTNFSWRLVTGLGGGQGLTAATTVVLGALAVAITSVLTGQFTGVLNELVHLAQAQLPPVPMPVPSPSPTP